MIKWELKEKYDKQDQRFHEIRARYDKAVIEAGTHLADLIAQKDAILRQEFQTGKDFSADKQRINAAIETAKEAKTQAEEDRAKAYEFATSASLDGRITIRDLTVDWNTNYAPMVRTKEFPAILERVKKARAEYLNGIIDYYDMVAKYEPAYLDMRQLELSDARPGDGIAVHQIVSESDLSLITSEDLHKVGVRKELPADVKRLKIGDDAE
ncbi:hypothetical protein [Paenibacillus sp. J22TS3]|uniref:hypothetical protein n=1 Tax=Paenibacillus sp. J22TS3 TaxID=2807192 RepID=UPI001B0C463C|nr:hypothetical protein [Paenibacillus sp. J22TS3]GIP21061.1 hypothetical protein J22TS3_13360 [Paenibacillus sp. J22TS3]